jgi:hypothetical protein
VQVAFNLLEDMRASGLTPSTPTCSALIYACLQNNNFAAARKVGKAAHQKDLQQLLEGSCMQCFAWAVEWSLSPCSGPAKCCLVPPGKQSGMTDVSCKSLLSVLLAADITSVFVLLGLYPVGV